MSNNDKPGAGILSAEQLAEIRTRWERLATAIGIDRALTPEEEIAAEEDSAALLAHIDALTPPSGTVDAEAGRRLYYELYPTAHPRSWEVHDPEVRNRHQAAAERRYALGYAAGRSEGDQLAASMADKARGAVDHVGAVAGDALATKDAEIARLTAELAESKNTIRQLRENLAMQDVRGMAMAREEAIEEMTGRIEQARADGAREEREACAKSLIEMSNDPLVNRRMDLVAGILAAVECIRARGAK